VADLLEALLQIKALAETPARVTELLHSTDADRWTLRRRPAEWAPVEVLAHLADTELLFGLRVRLILSASRPSLPVLEQRALAERAGYLSWPPAMALNRFRARRGETIERLASCSAEELERVGLHPVRREVTLADLIAIMLAHDTDHVGQMRERLGFPGGR
jgi:uncharacterized damage-inducible protein DinB